MSELLSGTRLLEIRDRIGSLRRELAELGSVPADVPGLIDSSNTLRKNIHLERTDELKSALVENLDAYAQELESLLNSVIDIQKDLGELLRLQNNLIRMQDKPRKRK